MRDQCFVQVIVRLISAEIFDLRAVPGIMDVHDIVRAGFFGQFLESSQYTRAGGRLIGQHA